MSSDGGDFSLLDVFISIRPDPTILADTEAKIDEYVKRVTDKFSGISQSAAAQASALAAQVRNIQIPNVGGPGGAAGGGTDSARDDIQTLRRLFLELQRDGEDTSRAMQELGRFIKEAGSPDSIQQFDILLTALKELNIEIRRSRQDIGAVGVEGSEDALNAQAEALRRVTERLRDLQSQAAQQFGVRSDFDAILELEKRLRAEENVRDTFAQSRIRGLPSAKDREEILRIREAIKAAQLEFDQAAQSFDGTKESLERLRAAFERLNGPLDSSGRNLANNVDDLNSYRQALASTQGNLAQSGQSMNTLSNNAYQLGQAFEDAAVGYQLNGIAGAVRGAANNVAFLLNDLSRIPALQDLVGKKWANIIPLAAGIGSAIGITILPALAEWLEALDDIQGETIDLASLIENRFRDLSFSDKLRIRREDIAGFIEDATTITDIVDRLRELDKEAKGLQETLKVNLGAILNPQEKDTFFNDLTTIREAFRDLNNSTFSDRFLGGIISPVADTESAIENYRRLIQIRKEFGDERGPDGAAILSEEEADTLYALEQGLQRIGANLTNLERNEIQLFSPEGLQAATREVETFRQLTTQELLGLKSDLAQLQQQFDKGVFNDAAIKTALDSVRELEDRFKRVSENLDLADGQIQRIPESLSAVRSRLEEAREISAQIASIYNDEFRAGIEGVISKNRELADQMQILRLAASGSATEVDVFLFQLDQQQDKLRENLDLVLQTAKDKGVAQQLIDQARAAGEQFNRDTIEIELIKTRTSLLERVNKLKEEEIEKMSRAKSVSLDRYASEIQLSQLSFDNARQRREQELREVQIEAIKLLEGQSAFRVGMDIGPAINRDFGNLSNNEIANKLDMLIKQNEFMGQEQINVDRQGLNELKRIDGKARAQ